ncbi:MAG: class I SAM-dependent methyltransferase [Chlamydiia bacterium]|nr:class I SAM-dependent methyltransferase [Chlamydiia bacterium]
MLDLGCRDGSLTRSFASGNQVIGVDIDRKGLQIVQKNLGIETQWLDLNSEWPFAEGKFDAIVCCEILEHLFFPHILIEHIHKSLSPGGIFIGSVPNSFRLRNRCKFFLGHEFDKDPTHVRLFSTSKIEQMLQGRFSSIEIVPIQGKVLPFLPVVEGLPRVFVRLFAKDLLWRAQKIL